MFITVCQAVQHAHQKGIIHRDLKPSNILVTINDGAAVPKVIDFGVAKATQGRLTEQTVYTQFQQMVGTPLYMSPEQAEMTSLDIDTRSDIYSLGVLLYELLTGRTPIDKETLARVGLDEVRRVIREVDPQLPSMRVRTLQGDELTTTAKRRHVEPGKLPALLRGDLDWIVMKCLEKDRKRRYDTANGLALDLRRHLANEIVTARPPTTGYLLGRLIRRNKLAFAASAAIAAALVIGFGVSMWMFFKEKHARERAVVAEQKSTTDASKSQQVAQFLKDMLNGVGPSVALGRDTILLREILDQTALRVSRDLPNQPLVEADLRQTLGLVYADISEWSKAAEMQRQALALRRKILGDEHPDVASSLCDLGATLHMQSRFTEAEPLLREALAMRRKLLGSEHPDLARSLTALALPLHREGRDEEAETLAREALGIQKKLYGDEHQEIARTLNVLAAALRSSGRSSESEALLRQVLAIQRKLLGSEHPDIALTLLRIGVALNVQGKPAAAEPFARESLTMRIKLLGNDHADVAWSMGYLAGMLIPQGKLDEAEPLMRQALAMNKKHLGAESEGVGYNLVGLGDLFKQRGSLEDAKPFYRQALDVSKSCPAGTTKGSCSPCEG